MGPYSSQNISFCANLDLRFIFFVFLCRFRIQASFFMYFATAGDQKHAPYVNYLYNLSTSPMFFLTILQQTSLFEDTKKQIPYRSKKTIVKSVRLNMRQSIFSARQREDHFCRRFLQKKRFDAKQHHKSW